MDKLLTVNEVSKITGVSIRTLHYYDGIGLLTPVKSTDAGYRLYDDTSLRRLQSIMLFRELEFSLKEIKGMIDSSEFDQLKALNDQIELLKLKRDRLDELIDFANRLKVKGETAMSFKAFDKSKIEAYRKMAKETWGDTEAYQEYEKKYADYSDTDQRRIAEGLMNVFYEFGDMKEKDPGEPEVQNEVKKLQDYITANYYTCTKPILKGLGQMYVAGGEMTENIDVAGGSGCADFVSRAIDIYCAK